MRARFRNATVLLSICSSFSGSWLVGCDSEPIPEEEFVVIDPAARPVPEAECVSNNPLRNAYFGDLHVHTSLSSDAWMFDVRVLPDDAYRYAFGEPILLPPNDEQGNSTRPVTIDRPLDFAAVTDHAEFLGESALCQDPKSMGYDSTFCEMFRAGEGRAPRLLAQIFSPITWRNDEVCGADGAVCRAVVRGIWAKTIAAAERWNDRSHLCERTAFVAYEYSSHRMGSNLHRNVIFKNEIVPNLPTSYFDADREWKLWDILERGCNETGTGCDALAIPHNSNISNGRMFAVDYPDAESEQEQAERAALRMRIEPIIEIFQHKGDSECRGGTPGVLESEDELCEFERFEQVAMNRFADEQEDGSFSYDECSEGALQDSIPHLGPDCVSRLSYVRYSLVEGLKEEGRIGVNPFKFGITASTDTHNGLAGGVEERSYPGHLGKGDETPTMRVQASLEIAGNVNNNPGGLTGIWAEENDRAALFDAMRRKEVFGTSGPRIQPRFFGAWSLPADLCDASDWLERANGAAVPMGGALPAHSPGASPTFLATALADVGTAAAPGNDLQRVQIVKGWVGSDGTPQTKVYDVAGTPENGASVDPETCQPRGQGHRQLCAVWTDPDFDPSRRAVYYARTVENPSCRYNAWQCLSLEGDARPADCDDPAIPKVIQERAWTSPIWYGPR
jgi:hypothetical protein